MTYLEDEMSAHDGQPIELYEFYSNSTTYRFTSHVESVEFSGHTFNAIPITRGSLEGGTQEDSPTIEIRMPYTERIVKDFAYGVSPNSLQLIIYRLHTATGQPIEYWRGEVAAISVSGRVAKFRVPSVLAGKMKSSVPGTFYQSQCNHCLYSSRCGISSEAYKLRTTVLNISSNGASLVLASSGGASQNWFKAGEIIRASDGERRMVVYQSGASIDLNYPFPNIKIGDTVNIYAGCDHTVGDCRDKFNNIINFGGHPFIPSSNIFAVGFQ
jgi:uncharacterized phage protein (TIGR02218 family)